MIDILIFSKDRACQLDLCLRSLYEQFPIDKNIVVQYTVSNEEYQNGYNN